MVIAGCSKPDANEPGTPSQPKPTPPTPVSDYVNFADAKFKAYVVGLYDVDKDGEISADEAKKVTSIDCKSLGISSLSGIRCFAELTSLNCSGNNLTTLVLSSKKATKGSVSEGDCSKLVFIDCSNNDISSITIDGCPELATLNCSDNQLSSLDVSNNQNLSTLDCTGNENLSEVIVSEDQTIENVSKDEGTVIKPEGVAVESVVLDKTSVELTEGDKVTLTATVKPDNASNKKVSWSSSDETIATVKDGVVSAISKGTAIITVKTDDGGKTASCDVIIKEKSSLEDPDEGDTYEWD